MYSDFGAPPPEPRGNGARLCCGNEPFLRVRLHWQAADYVFFECRSCGAKGGLSLDEEEALQEWNNK